MSGGDNGCGSELLRVTNIQLMSDIPQTEQHLPFGLLLLCLGNVTIICIHTYLENHAACQLDLQHHHLLLLFTFCVPHSA